jgi:hypothetical protein
LLSDVNSESRRGALCGTLSNLNARYSERGRAYPQILESLTKEVKLYTKEADEQQKRLEKYIADNAEEWDIKNAVGLNVHRAIQFDPNHAVVFLQRKVHEEGLKMIPDTQNRLSKAAADLKELIVSRAR